MATTAQKVHTVATLRALLTVPHAKHVAKQIAAYVRGVTWFNAVLAAEFGDDQYILTRGKGYYYWRGDGPRVSQLNSVYVYTLDMDDMAAESYVIYELEDAIKEIRAALKAEEALLNHYPSLRSLSRSR